MSPSKSGQLPNREAKLFLVTCKNLQKTLFIHKSCPCVLLRMLWEGQLCVMSEAYVDFKNIQILKYLR
jgi:hypothetical protein